MTAVHERFPLPSAELETAAQLLKDLGGEVIDQSHLIIWRDLAVSGLHLLGAAVQHAQPQRDISIGWKLHSRDDSSYTFVPFSSFIESARAQIERYSDVVHLLSVEETGIPFHSAWIKGLEQGFSIALGSNMTAVDGTPGMEAVSGNILARLGMESLEIIVSDLHRREESPFPHIDVVLCSTPRSDNGGTSSRPHEGDIFHRGYHIERGQFHEGITERIVELFHYPG